MARAFQTLSRAFHRLRLGHNNRNATQPAPDMDTDEPSPPATPTHSSHSGRRTEKRKISPGGTPTSRTDIVERRHSNSSSTSLDLGLCDVTDATSLERDCVANKRRRTPDNKDPEQCCSRSIGSLDDDERLHTFLFRVRRDSVGGGAADGLVRLGRSGSRASLHQTSSSAECRLPCDMGDVWTEAYYEQPLDRHKQVSTGDDFTDRILSTIQFKGYVPQSRITQGEFSSVLLAASSNQRSSAHRYVALKFITHATRKKTQGILHPWQSDVPDEARVLKDLHHPHIVELLDFWPIHGRQCIVLEFCQNGNVQDLLEKRPCGFFPEPICRRYLSDMLAAIEYLHVQCLVHRDVTARNFLVDSHDRVKLCDFRFAIPFKAGDNFRRDHPGTPSYYPPEYGSSEPYNPRMVDIWSLGLVLYVMVTGRLPQGENKLALNYRNIKNLPFPDEVLILSPQVRELVLGMCSFIPETRYSLTRVRCSPWLQTKTESVFIGNYHLARQPRKVKQGKREEECKMQWDV